MHWNVESAMECLYSINLTFNLLTARECEICTRMLTNKDRKKDTK